MTQQRLLNTSESAAYLGVGYETFVENVRPALHPVQVHKKRKLYDIRELDAFIESSKGETPAEQQWQMTNSPKPAPLVSTPAAVCITSASNTSVKRFRELLASK